MIASWEAHDGQADLLDDHVARDGYVADEDGSFDWAVPDEEVHMRSSTTSCALSASTSTGAGCTRSWVGWETAHTLADQRPVMRDFAQIWRAADKVVYSRTLATLSSARTRIERDFAPETIRQQMKVPR